MPLPFVKMHGAGNDFVIFDARQQPLSLTPDQVRAVAARDNAATHGCDQVIVMESSPQADVFMRIYNADGLQVDACGNATRCIAGILEKELQRLPVTIRTNAGLLQGLKKAQLDGQDYILVDMGAPRFGWQDIPLAMPVDQAKAKIEEEWGTKEPSFVSMGNPHVVFFMVDAASLAALPLHHIGPQLEQAHEIFPQGVNVTIAALIDGVIHARVWERGAGLTKACGTAACATLAALNRRAPAIRDVAVRFEPSQQLVSVQVSDSGHILLGGPVVQEFVGEVTL